MTFGSVTAWRICQPLAPSTSAASSSSVPCDSMNGMSSRATNGNVTNTVARTIPGTANTTFTPWSASHGPSHPCAPKRRIVTIPEMTGDTPNGKSMSDTSALFPR